MNRRKFLKTIGFGGAFTVLAASYPVFIERNIVKINRYRITVPSLPSSFNGFKIVQLTDLHYGPLVSLDFIEGVVEKANKHKPDIIVCTGDYVHERNSTEQIDAVWPVLLKLKAKHGVYSVLGNHDHWADTSKSIEWLERSGQSVRHICRAIYRSNERIVIGGAGDLWEDKLNIDECFKTSDENDFRVLLTHNPDSVDTKFTTPVSLFLSGHTHGGQVSIPFYGPPVLPVKNKKYSRGLINTDKGPLFISKGIGWAIYPVRFNCAPEIAVLELFAA